MNQAHPFEVVTTKNKKIQGWPVTNWIDQVAYGIDEKAQNGYSAGQIFPNLANFNQVFVWSNGLQYLLGPRGMTLHITRAFPESSTTGPFSRPLLSKGTLLLTIFVSATIAWAVLRRAKAGQLENLKRKAEK